MITTTGEYALRAVVFLAQEPETPFTNAQIAEGTQVPSGYLSKIMQSLVRRKVVSSQRGLGGGFVLARSADSLTVFDVLEAVDSAPERIQKCPLGLKGHVRLCPVHKLVDEAIAHAERAFRSANIAELAKSTRGIKPLCDTADD